MNNLEQKELELRKQKNQILDNLLAKINEQEMNLMMQTMNQKRIENDLIRKKEIKNQKRRRIEYLLEDNNNLKIDIIKKEYNHKLELKELENEYDIQKVKMENEHKNKIYSLEIENQHNKNKTNKKINEIKLIDKEREYKNKLKTKKIKNKHKIMMDEEEMNNKLNMQKISDNTEIMKLDCEYGITKNNFYTELEIKKIENDLEINKTKNEFDYEIKLKEQEFLKYDGLSKQNLERVEMELKFQLLMGKLALDQIQELNNT